jgi:hypothetical protein
MKVLPLTFALSLILFLISCGTVTRESLSRQTELYASRIAFGWQKLGCFQLRGNARLQGSNLVAHGPFILWGDTSNSLLRGDFYGPDGRPVVSVRGDSTGMMVYMPQDEYAVFMPGGLHAGEGTLPVRDLIHLLRTGFPIEMEAWEITGCASISGDAIQWAFCSGDSLDRMVLSMDYKEIFPTECEWGTGEFSISASSPHDEYNAWPWGWTTMINGNSVDLELTDINTNVIPWEGIWGLMIPVHIDTLAISPFWEPENQPETI